MEYLNKKEASHKVDMFFQQGTNFYGGMLIDRQVFVTKQYGSVLYVVEVSRVLRDCELKFTAYDKCRHLLLVCCLQRFQ